MQTEFETKVLEIDVNAIVAKLEDLGAEKLGEKNQQRHVYDFIPKKEDSWVRLRTDGLKTTLAIKEIQNDAIDGTKELEIFVDDFEETHLFLKRLGFAHKGYQENKRISYLFEEVEIEIDFWPLIPPYLEVEGKSVVDVERMIGLLGFDMSQTTSINTKGVYKKYGIDIDSMKELRFA